MARDDKQQNHRLPTGLMNRLRSIQRQKDSIYSDTYSTTPQVRSDLERISSDVEDNVNKILHRNANDSISNLSKLYSIASLRDAVSNEKFNQDIVDFFENRQLTDALVNSYMDNKWIAEMDREYDIVCKYMPMLVEALNTIKDSVLSADNLDKEYLTFRSLDISHTDTSTFDAEIVSLKKQYDIYERVDRWYDQTSKYGECFVYKVPYNKAFAILMNRKDRTKFSGLGNMTMISHENTVGTDTSCTLINESGSIAPTIANKLGNDSFLENSNVASIAAAKYPMKNIKLEICKDGVLQTAVNESKHMKDMLTIAESASVNEKVNDNSQVINSNTFVPAKTKKDMQSAEGIITYKASQFKTPGLLLKELERKNVIMLYLESVCLGYYYIEFMNKEGNPLYSDSLFMRTAVSNVGYTAGAKFQDIQSQTTATDELLRYLSAAIVANLNDKFINNNPYLKKEIYSVLKFNDVYNNADLSTIRVTYLSPKDVEHIKFREDPETHRGISDLAAGLITSKMWCCLNIANTLGILTRGQDKRVYYVKQNVEQNIAQTLLNVINQIKKQNFNIMQIENMNSILGITGKFNDYIIPVGPSGDSPIQMEVMEGQNIDPQTELLDKLEEQSVNSTDVPIELVRARLSVDFATQLTMSNSKFSRFIFKRQAKFEEHLGNIMTDIYNTETQSNITVICTLPAPLMLNMNNLSQILEIIQRQAETLAQIIYTDTNDQGLEAKQKLFIKNYVTYKLGSYIKKDELDIIKTKTDLEYEQIKSTENQEA